MGKIAIVVVAFNRPDSLKRLLTSLNNLIIFNDSDITLHISIDKKRNDFNNDKTISVADSFEWKFGKKVVDVKETNFGLKKHVLYCGNLVNKYENIIVLEDDLVVSPLLYEYSLQCISYYDTDEHIAGFGLYSFQRNPMTNLPFIPLNNGSDVFYIQYACSWGQLWTKNRWNSFYNWFIKNENNDFSKMENIPYYIKRWGQKSWLKYHIFYCIINDKYFVFPQFGLTSNFTEGGTHNMQSTNAYQCNLYYFKPDTLPSFRFSSFDSSLNIYDAFFENVKINELIDCPSKIESDFYGQKSLKNNMGLYLSSKKYDYKILQSYSLQMIPFENNIIYNIVGSDLFLYDTSVIEKNRFNSNSDRAFLFYLFRINSLYTKDIIKFLKFFASLLIHRFFLKVFRGKKSE